MHCISFVSSQLPKLKGYKELNSIKERGQEKREHGIEAKDGDGGLVTFAKEKLKKGVGPSDYWTQPLDFLLTRNSTMIGWCRVHGIMEGGALCVG